MPAAIAAVIEALQLLAPAVPAVESLIKLLQNPNGATQADADAAVAAMKAHVAQFDADAAS